MPLLSAQLPSMIPGEMLPVISFETGTRGHGGWTFLVGDHVPRKDFSVTSGTWDNVRTDYHSEVGGVYAEDYSRTRWYPKVCRKIPEDLRHMLGIVQCVAAVYAAARHESVVGLCSPENFLSYSERRFIVPLLQKMFPREQFIVTTSDPQILAHARPRQIRLVKGDTVESCPYDPRFYTVHGIADMLLGERSIYPNKLGELVAQWNLEAHNPHRFEKDEEQLNQIERELRQAKISLKVLGLKRTPRKLSENG